MFGLVFFTTESFYRTEMEEAVLHWSGKSVKHAQVSTFNDSLIIIGPVGAWSVELVPTCLADWI